jgi:hypothetical protein
MIIGDEKVEIPGAQPFTAMKAAIDAVLTENETDEMTETTHSEE